MTSPRDTLLKLAEAWADAKAAVSYAGGSRSANPDLDPDGRILELAIDECREARAAFIAALPTVPAGEGWIDPSLNTLWLNGTPVDVPYLIRCARESLPHSKGYLIHELCDVIEAQQRMLSVDAKEKDVK